jgi:hypothetical protein
MNSIKLIKSGGFVAGKMSASTEWKFSAGEWDELVEAIKREEGKTKSRDAFHYSIQKNEDEKSRVPVSIQTIPPKFSAVFKELFDKMKAEK